MARLKVVHSQDSCMVIIRGDKRNPEPTLAVIKFPGGEVEISRCSDGVTYWAHLHINESSKIVDSRVDYTHKIYMERHNAGLAPIAPIAEEQHIKKMAVKVLGNYESTDLL